MRPTMMNHSTAAPKVLNDLTCNYENSICDDNCTLYMFSQWTIMCTIKPINLIYERKIAAPSKHIFVHYPCKTHVIRNIGCHVL